MFFSLSPFILLAVYTAVYIGKHQLVQIMEKGNCHMVTLSDSSTFWMEYKSRNYRDLFQQRDRLLVKCSNEHTTLESRKIECFLERVTNNIQLWKFSHSFEMLGFI